jgi:acetylornithine/succinyldiaminopimelate/putrescine aminotransferase
MPCPKQTTLSKKSAKQVFHFFGKHISKGQIRYLSAGHLDLLEGMRHGLYFREKESGQSFIDAFTSAGCFNVGRRNPAVIGAIDEASGYFDMGIPGLLSRSKVEFANKLTSLSPGDMKKISFAGSGADAVEGAIKLARGATGREKVISMAKAYHGHSGFSLSANGKDYYKELFQPLVPGFSFAPFGDLEAVIRLADEKTAAVIIEPIQGEGGIHVGEDTYLRGLRDVCDALGILLIFDEIQTGFGRTGKMWASEHSGVVPDIMVLAKSIGGGVYPNAAIIYRDIPVLTDYVEKNPFFHRSSGGGTDLGCLVASKVIDVIVENRLWENARIMGDRFKNGLCRIRSENPGIIREVRGRGMMIGIEYTREYMGVLMADCLARKGMFAVYSGNAPQVMRFQLPLTATSDEIDNTIETIRKAVTTMKMYLLALIPISKLPYIGRLLDNQSFLVSLNVFIRKFEFRV